MIKLKKVHWNFDKNDCVRIWENMVDLWYKPTTVIKGFTVFLPSFFKRRWKKHSVFFIYFNNILYLKLSVMKFFYYLFVFINTEKISLILKINSYIWPKYKNTLKPKITLLKLNVEFKSVFILKSCIYF